MGGADVVSLVVLSAGTAAGFLASDGRGQREAETTDGAGASWKL